MQLKIDPITFEVVNNALESIADEMALVLMRSSYSPVVRDSMDYSTALCDRNGFMVAQGLTTALHLGSFPDAMRILVKDFGEDMNPGDVFISNDPYGAGGMHLPDIYITKPIFLNDEVEGYAISLVHHTDVGGIAPGSNSAFSKEIYQEGLRIPLLKLFNGGQPNDAIFRIIEKNVRVPSQVMGDLRAQLAACRHAEKAFSQLAEKYGRDFFRFYLSELQLYSERMMRSEIEGMPDGEYEFTDYIDGLGEDPRRIKFRVKVSIKGDTVIVDWTGSSPQVKAGINAPLPFTHSTAYLAIRCITSRNIPNNEGYMRPIQVIAPEGTIMNPRLPAACATRGITGFRMLDTLFGALAKAVPERVPAAGEGGATFPSFGGYHDSTPFVFTESTLGNWGGRPDRDGEEGVPNPGANQSNQPIELIESQLPIQILNYGFVQDTGGAGKYRGGLSLVREYRMLAEETVMSMRSDRRFNLPYGLHGGKPGTPSWNIVNPGPAQGILPPLPAEGVILREGDILRHIQAGGGGWGNPLERDIQKVHEDVLEEKLSVGYAKRIYGVVIDPVSMELDAEATEKLRAQMAEEKSD